MVYKSKILSKVVLILTTLLFSFQSEAFTVSQAVSYEIPKEMVQKLNQNAKETNSTYLKEVFIFNGQMNDMEIEDKVVIGFFPYDLPQGMYFGLYDEVKQIIKPNIYFRHFIGELPKCKYTFAGKLIEQEVQGEYVYYINLNEPFTISVNSDESLSINFNFKSE